ncbi:MAG: DUF4465 domain-containing protein [Pirellulales bacterium]|nr:DUF4465 domain-containing protein [Pirellulales bacterium]
MKCCPSFSRVSPVALAACALICVSQVRAVTVDFEDLALAPQSHWSGPDPNGQIVHQTTPWEDDLQIGKFTSAGVDFSNSYSLNYYSYAGFAYSNMTHNPADYMPGDGNPGDGSNGNPHPVPTGWASEFYAVPGGDANPATPAGNYAMGYVSTTFKPTVAFSAPTTLNGMYVANNNWAYYVMKEGDPLHWARQFTTGDYFKLTIVGLNVNGSDVSVDYYLADFRDPASRPDNPVKGNYISNQWTWVDLSSFGGPAAGLEFRLFSTDSSAFGINTPTYFALDDLTTVGNPANEIVWNNGGNDGLISNPANWNGQTPSSGKAWRFAGTGAGCQFLNNDLPANTANSSITIASGCFFVNGNALKLTGDVSTLSVEPITLAMPLLLDGGNRFFHSAGGDLTIGGVIGESGGAFGIVKTGRGKVMLRGNNTYRGATRVESGTLALELGGNISTDSAIYVAAGAMLRIEEGSHLLGTITGAGTLLVDDGASLTAASITQSALILGTPQTVAVPEPNLFLLLAAGLAAVIVGRRFLRG